MELTILSSRLENMGLLEEPQTFTVSNLLSMHKLGKAKAELVCEQWFGTGQGNSMYQRAGRVSKKYNARFGKRAAGKSSLVEG